ncbi:hypothetical protein V8D89_011210 [Ganoderma adspersum]
MSSPTAEEDAQLIAIAAALAPSNYIIVAICALLAYEWVIGLGKEINLFWREKVIAATVLFLLNRYAPLVYFLSSFSGSSAFTDKVSCSAYLRCKPDRFAVFSALRTYALCGKRWTVAIPVLILSSVPLGLNLTRLYWSHGEIVPIWGCDTIIIVPANISLMFLLSLSGVNELIEPYCSASFHTTSFISNRRRCNRGRRHLVDDLQILLILNVLHLTFTVLSIATQGGGGDETSYIISFTEPITAILVSRFMFDLQKAKQKSQRRGDVSDTLATGLDRALGSIGSTLSTSDVWRPGPGFAAGRGYVERGPESLFTKFEPDVFGKGVATSVILEVESTPSLRRSRVPETV